MLAELGGNFFFGEAGFFNLGVYLAACATTAYASWRQWSLYFLFGGIYLQQYLSRKFPT